MGFALKGFELLNGSVSSGQTLANTNSSRVSTSRMKMSLISANNRKR